MIADTITATAVDYHNRGYCPIPIPFQQKAPKLDKWQAKRWNSIDEVRQNFSQLSNIGVLLGEPSGHLIDVDLDHSLAVELAPIYLPSTAAVFGRAGKRKSHYLFRVTSPTPTKKIQNPEKRWTQNHRGIAQHGLPDGFPEQACIHRGKLSNGNQTARPAVVEPDTLLAQLQALSNEVCRRLGLEVETTAQNCAVNSVVIPGDIADRARKYLAKIPAAVSEAVATIKLSMLLAC